jgi:hypothetical protein
MRGKSVALVTLSDPPAPPRKSGAPPIRSSSDRARFSSGDEKEASVSAEQTLRGLEGRPSAGRRR